MREQLLGYLIGALEPNEYEAVEDGLLKDEQLRQDLEVLRESLNPLAADRDHYNPPLGLAIRTCEFVVEQQAVISMPRPAAAAAAVWNAGPAPQPGHWTMADFSVAAGIAVAAAMLFFPAVNSSRFAAQLAVCQNNLRQLFMAQDQYSQVHAGIFPQIPKKGNLAVAGAYAPMLKQAGLLKDDSTVVCPSSSLVDMTDFHIPSEDEVLTASVDRLPELKRTMGGSYGNNIGYEDEGAYHPTRNLARRRFALMADAPSLDLEGFGSMNHGGNGQNVLFEDGHIEHLVDCQLSDCLDRIYSNTRGEIAPGTHKDDSVIGASAIPVMMQK